MVQEELLKTDRQLKFSPWFFMENMDASQRTELMVPRKKYFQELNDKINWGSTNTLVFAYPGQGKTVSTKYYFNELSRKDPTIKTIYVNCKQEDTEKKIFKKVIFEMSKSWPAILDIDNERAAIYDFVSHIPQKDTFYLILDEIDVPVINDKKTHKGEFLTVFFRASEERPFDVKLRKPVWQTIMITNKLAFEQTLDINERQHIQHMGLTPYNPQEIYEILNRRLEIGVRNNDISPNLFSSDMLSYIAKIVADGFNSNLRVAFQLVLHTGKIAISNNTPVTKEFIEESIKLVDIDLLLNDIRDLPLHSRIFFFSVMVYLKNKHKLSSFKGLEEKGYSYKNFYLKEIYPIFEKFCAKNNIRLLKSTIRSCQTYVVEGHRLGIYSPTGVTSQKHREYELVYDVNLLWTRISDDYPMYDFDISIKV